MDISELSDAFYDGQRSKDLPFIVNDSVVVIAGPNRGRQGAAITLDCATAELSILVEFGDGTDELIPVSNLELHEAAS